MRLRSRWLASLLAGVHLAALPALAVEVGGRVFGPDGGPLAGARVELTAALSSYDWARETLAGRLTPEPLAVAETDEDGRFVLEASGAGIFHVIVGAEGFVPMRYSRLALVEPVELPPVTLAADAGSLVEVVSEGESPAAGVQLAARPASRDPWRGRIGDGWSVDFRLGHSDEHGRLVLPRAAGEELRVEAFRPRLVAAASATGGERIRLDLVSGAVSDRTLEVSQPSGEPLPGVVALAAHSGWPVGITDAAGRLSLAAADADAELRLLTADGRRGSVTLKAPRRTLGAADRVRGRVLAADGGGPLPGALVWPLHDPGRFTFTDSRGDYELGATPGEALRIGVAAAGFAAARVRCTAGQAPAPAVALERTLEVRGRAVTGDGAALRGVLVEAVPLAPAPRSAPLSADRADARVVSDAAGRFVVGNLHPAGKYRLVASRGGYLPASLVLDPPRPRASVRLELTRSRPARGRVADRRGQAVAGAEVRLLATEPADPRREPESVLSGADGAFELATIPSSRFDLEARAAGFAPARKLGLEAPPGDGPVDLGTVTLVRGALIVGRVLDPERRPIDGVAVHRVDDPYSPARQVLRRATGEEPLAVTDSEGRFRIEGLERRRPVHLLFERSGYLPARRAGVEPLGTEAEARRTLEVTLRPASALRGRVVDAAGNAIADARVEVGDPPSPPGTVGVRLRNADNRATVLADDDGRFTVDGLAPGRIELTAFAEGFQPSPPIGVEVPADRELDGLELVLERGAVIEGRVLTADGEPIAGARLRTEEAGGLSDAEGHYRVAGVAPGSRELVADHPEYERKTETIEVEPGVNLVDLELAAGWPVAGRVLSEDREAVPDARVELRIDAGLVDRSYRTFADEDGAFRLPRVVDGTYDVTAAGDGYGTVELDHGLTVAGRAVDDLEVVLPPEAVIAGRVLGLEPAELARVEVEAIRGEGAGVPGRVDFRGRYEVSGLAPGTWRVRAVLDGGRRQAEARRAIEPGTRRVEQDLELGDGLTLGGRVLYGGEPLPEARLLLLGRESGVERSTLTDHRGRFRLADLAPGRYWISLSSPREMLTHNQEVELYADREVEIELATAHLAGRVVADERPVPEALIQLQQLIGPAADQPASLTTVATDARGAFTFARLSAGRYRLNVRREGYEPLERTLDLAPGAAIEDLVLSLDPTLGLLISVRLAAGGTPGALTVVVLGSEGRPASSETRLLGPQGRMRFSSIPLGTSDLVIGSPGAATTRVTVRVPGPTLDLVLPEAADLEVRVPSLMAENQNATATLLDPGGRPFLGLDGYGQPRQTWDLTGGVGVVPGVPAGLWTVQVVAADGRLWQQAVVTERGRVEVSLE